MLLFLFTTNLEVELREREITNITKDIFPLYDHQSRVEKIPIKPYL